MRFDRSEIFTVSRVARTPAVTMDKDWMAGNGVGEWWIMIYHGNRVRRRFIVNRFKKGWDINRGRQVLRQLKNMIEYPEYLEKRSCCYSVLHIISYFIGLLPWIHLDPIRSIP